MSNLQENHSPDREPRFEVHNGVIVDMSPSARPEHNIAVVNISRILANYLHDKPCQVFTEGVDAYLTENDTFVPDLSVVCNCETFLGKPGIMGAPDMVIEILSPSTAIRDRGYKKSVYEKTGVKEYWIVDIHHRVVEVYVLHDGKYADPVLYAQNGTVKAINPSMFPDLDVPLEDIFDGLPVINMPERCSLQKEYQTDREPRFEVHNGVIVDMSPSPRPNHMLAVTRLSNIFTNHLIGKPCRVFGDGMDVYLTDSDTFKPDLAVVCNREMFKGKPGIMGAPDLVVEILSRSTAERDKGYKKSVYEKTGVKEYWIVDIDNRVIEVYVLRDGRYAEPALYSLFGMNKVINPSIFPDLDVPLEDVFDWVED